MATFLRLMAVAALLLLPAASAQAPALPVAPTATVTVALDAGPTTVSLGGNGTIPVSVTLAVSNIVCPQPSAATVTLTVNHQPGPLNGIAATITPSTLTFNLTAQQYASPGFSGTQAASLSYAVARSVSPDHPHAFNVTATFAGDIGGCSPAPGQTMPSASGSAAHAIKTGPASNGNGNQTSGPADVEAEDSPGPELPFLAILALAVVALRRRGL